jgi:undecaprenyl-diphosphatase
MDTSERFGERFRDHRPAVVAIWLIVAGFLVTAAVLVLMGLFITQGPLAGPIGRWDAHVSQWFVNHRTGTWNRVTVFGSGLGMTEVIVGLELVALLVLAVIRRWRDAAFLFCAVTLEASVAFTTSIIVDRPRPDVIRLDDVPPTKSFPSGHTAAAIALYVGLAIILTPHVRHAAFRALIWLFAVLIPVFVGISRVYRGMHHATDVFGSVILGTLALGVAWLIVACVASVWRERLVTIPETTVAGIDRAPVEATP